MAKIFTKKRVKKIVSIVLALATAVGAIFGIKAVVDEINNPQKTIHPKFEVGGLTNLGQHENTDDTIYTKKAFEAKGLEIKLDFDASVEYQVFFYDDLDKFISCTEVYSESQDISVPAGAFARIEVTPIWGADAPLDKEIKWYNVNKYSKQLEINVDKRQELLESDFEKINLLDETVFSCSEGMYVNASGELASDSLRTTYSTVLDKDYSKMYVSFSKPLEEVTGFVFVIVHVDGTVDYFDWVEVQKLSIDNLIDVERGTTLLFSIGNSQLDIYEICAMLYLA